jgi:hypothetical protein
VTEHDDEMIRRALDGLRRAEPTPAEIARAVASAPMTRRPRVLTHPRMAGVAVAVALMFASVSVHAGRAAFTRTFDSIGGFLSGSGSTPGRTLDRGERSLLSLGRATKGSPRVLVVHGGERVAAYRGADGQACFSLGLHGDQCFDNQSVRAVLLHGALGPLGAVRNRERSSVLLWGIASDAVAAITLRYGDGRTYDAVVGRNGFIAELPSAPDPPDQILIYDGAGNELAALVGLSAILPWVRP